MVTAISLAHRQRDGLSPGSPLDFVSHLTWSALCEEYTHPRGAGSFNWSWAVPSTSFHFDVLIALVFLLSTPFGEIRVISDSCPFISLSRNRDSRSDNYSLA